MSFAKLALSSLYSTQPKLYRAGKGSYKHMDLRLRPILNCYFTSVFQNFCRATTFFFYFGVLLFSLLWNPSLKIISDMGPSWRRIRRQGREKTRHYEGLWDATKRGVKLEDEPSGCLANLTPPCQEIVVARTLFGNVTARNGSGGVHSSEDVVCLLSFLDVRK